MAVKRKTTENEQISQADINSQSDYLDIEGMDLAQQIGDLGGDQSFGPQASQQVMQQQPQTEGMVGGQLRHAPGSQKEELRKEVSQITQAKHLTKVGESIQQSSDIRDGWMDVDKKLLGERAIFYPEDWQFRVRPATVEAIRNWSNIDDENWSSIDDVFNEVLKSCLTIRTSQGPKPWNVINSWDRFFFILLIREYTFMKGEKQIVFNAECPNCEEEIQFQLTSGSLGYEMPDPEVMPYYDPITRTWNIDPSEFEVETDVERITMYLPTLEKEANFKNWLMTKMQENRNYKPDATFMRFVAWLCPKISKDPTIAKQQIRQAEAQFKSWNTEMFSFMDDILRNIRVVPATHLEMKCPYCGEAVTAQIEFQNGVKDLFSISSRHKKFGKK